MQICKDFFFSILFFTIFLLETANHVFHWVQENSAAILLENFLKFQEGQEGGHVVKQLLA